MHVKLLSFPAEELERACSNTAMGSINRQKLENFIVSKFRQGKVKPYEYIDVKKRNEFYTSGLSRMLKIRR